MDRLTLGIAVDASRLETERFDEEVMRRRDVLVNQKWDDALELGHRLFLSMLGCMSCAVRVSAMGTTKPSKIKTIPSGTSIGFRAGLSGLLLITDRVCRRSGSAMTRSASTAVELGINVTALLVMGSIRSCTGEGRRLVNRPDDPQ
jgi:hypothetical protein